MRLTWLTLRSASQRPNRALTMPAKRSTTEMYESGLAIESPLVALVALLASVAFTVHVSFSAPAAVRPTRPVSLNAAVALETSVAAPCVQSEEENLF